MNEAPKVLGNGLVWFPAAGLKLVPAPADSSEARMQPAPVLAAKPDDAGGLKNLPALWVTLSNFQPKRR